MSSLSHSSKKGEPTPSSQKTDQFEPRPFGISDPFAQPAPLGQFDSRPFAVPGQPQTTVSQGTAAIQAKSKQPERQGFELSELNLLPPTDVSLIIPPSFLTPLQSSTTPLQRALDDSDDNLGEQESFHVVKQTSTAREQVAIGQMAPTPIVSCKVGWSGSKANKGLSTVSSINRIPIEDSTLNPTKVLILFPQGLDPNKPVQALLHFHGYNVGNIEQSPRDLDAIRDRFEEQMSVALKGGDTQLIGILPQSPNDKGKSFGKATSSPIDFVNDCITILNREASTNIPKPTGFIASGHSGGGNAIAGLAARESSTAPPIMQSVFLFEGINNFPKPNGVMAGRDKIDTYVKMIARRLRFDVNQLATMPTAQAMSYLASSFQFRAYYGSAGLYVAAHELVNQAIRMMFGEPLTPAEVKQQNHRLAGGLNMSTIPEMATLAADLAQLPTTILTALRDHYQVIKVGQSNPKAHKTNLNDGTGTMDTLGHDNIVGSGALLDALKATKVQRQLDQSDFQRQVASPISSILLPTIQCKKEHEDVLAPIQGHSMAVLLLELQSIRPEAALIDEDAGYVVGGSRLIAAMHAAKHRKDGKTWTQFIDGYEHDLSIFDNNKDQFYDIMKFLGAGKFMQPELCASFEEWMSNFPTHSGSSVANLDTEFNELHPDITKYMPSDLKHLIQTTQGAWRPDCADVNFFLRHYYFKKKGQTKRYGGILLGSGVSDNAILKTVQNSVNTGSFQNQLIKFYKQGKKNITNLKSLLSAGLKPGDLLIWKRLPTVTGNFQGHAQTIQNLSMSAKFIVVSQGTMQGGIGGGNITQSKYSFLVLTGDPEGNGEIKNRDGEESFYGAGPWK